jgi:hypothetical protein
MAGFDTPLSPVKKVTDNNPAASRSGTSHDVTKTMVLNETINIDSGVAGVGIVSDLVQTGSAQVFTAAAAAWVIKKPVKAADALGTTGGTLQKVDGTAFAVAGLPAAAAVFKNCFAFCTDGIRVCKSDGSAWVQMSAYT